jgi:hypothetical protein
MKGKYPPPGLPPCDDLLEPLLQRHENHLSRMSRALNEGFAFSALQATGRFVPFRGPANVVLEGRVYHQIRDVLNHYGRPAHWFIYDANRRAGRAAEDQPPQETLDLILGYLERVNMCDTFVLRPTRSLMTPLPSPSS